MPNKRRIFRNHVARNPLLGKGGPHQKSRSAERHNQQQTLRSELDEWREELEWLSGESAPDGADSSHSLSHVN